MGGGEVGRHGQSLFGLRRRALMIAAVKEGKAEPRMCLGIMGIEGDGTARQALRRNRLTPDVIPRSAP